MSFLSAFYRPGISGIVLAFDPVGQEHLIDESFSPGGLRTFSLARY